MNTLRLVALAAACAVSTPALAQNVFDDFSSGNDNAWTRIDGLAQSGGPASTFSVQNGWYSISSPAFSQRPTIPFIMSVRLDSAGLDTTTSIDVTGFVGSPSIQLISRGSQTASGAFEFYELSFLPFSGVGPGYSNLNIRRWNQSGPGLSSPTLLTSLSGNAFLNQIVPGDVYRMSLTAEGASVSASLYNLTQNPLTPLLTISAIDFAPLGSGVSGIRIISNAGDASQVFATGASFDNFRVVPAPGAAVLLGSAGLCVGRRRR